MEFLTDIHIWAGLLSLTALEIVLGIDNVVFIALLVGHLPPRDAARARMIGLTLALLMRIAMLLGVAWIISLRAPFVEIFGLALSGKDVMMLAGGLFLLYKATDGVHDELSDDKKRVYKTFTGGVAAVIMQIVIIDIVFSFDSVMTAVGMTENIYVIIAAMTIAMIVMLASSGAIAGFIAANPPVKMLALAFVMMIGLLLTAEGLGFHMPKGYIYFGMAFSLGVELLNIAARKRRQRRKAG